MNGDLGLFGPDQNPTVLFHRQPLCVHKFELQLLKARVIQFEYPAEQAARNALLALEQRRRQRHYLKEPHRVLPERWRMPSLKETERLRAVADKHVLRLLKVIEHHLMRLALRGPAQ
jgi:hypothetical protein